uniref:histidine kinase n=1 Tax=Ananas comosus var. bracteatus TaxID=296719 RepID=A0A6V7NJV1_ANACO|nr:unnamed protein product [Ananas comosus var. bracteatus]
MLRALFHGLLILSLLFSTSAAIEIGFSRCNCDGDTLWSAESILQCQKVSDFLIAAAYFSIPLELLYFATCSNLFPFKWIVIQFGAFIVLCGLTHLLNVFTYEPHSFLLVLSLTVSKFLTALVSFATAITLLTLIPQLLRIKVRENFLRIKARELDREVGLMKRQEEASWHVRMLTREIRKSLDRHTILYTTLVELSKTLSLENCAVWMPDESRMSMILTHQLRERSSSDLYTQSIPMDDPDVIEIKETKGVKILGPDSVLGGTPEVVEASYAILVLVLPRDDPRVWSYQELEIVEVVADQVAVALSHASVLEESQLMRDKLAEQNRVLLQAKQEAMMATEARNSFQKAMSQGMTRPIHSIMGLLSILQQEVVNPEQRLIVNSIAKTSSVVSTLINDVMEIATTNSEQLSLVMRPFEIRSMIKEALSVTKCLCGCKGIGFEFQAERSIPERVVGDEKRLFHLILHMVGTLVNGCDEGSLTFSVRSYGEGEARQDQEWVPWKSSLSDSYTCLKFEIGIKRLKKACADDAGQHLGNFKLQRPHRKCNSHPSIPTTTPHAGLRRILRSLPYIILPHFKGLRVLLADNDDVNRAVTRKLLEKLGCRVCSVSSGIECIQRLSSLGTSNTPFQIVIFDLNSNRMDGFEVAIRIRKFRSGCWPLVVGLTASAEESVWENCLQSGMNGLIRKPVTLQAMGDELYRVLQNT